MTRMNLTIRELTASTLFPVINARTSYNLLLGRPWVHGNGIVMLTLHQCFKFDQGGIKTVLADDKPFTETESHFADAKFYLDSNGIPKVIPVEIPSVRKEKMNEEKQVVLDFSREDVSSGKRATTTSFILKMPCNDTSLQGFVRPSQNSIEHGSLPEGRMEGFDPQAYKLLAKSGYDFADPSSLGELSLELIGEKVHGLNETQRKLRKGKNKRSTTTIELNSTKEDDETRSLILSRMKHMTSLEVSVEGPLKVKRHTIILTGEVKTQAESKREEEIEHVGSHHVTVEEDSSSDSEDDDLQEAPPELEDGGQSTVDNLNNLGTPDDPRPIFVGTLLTPEDEKTFFELLLEYKDVFAWAYKDMPGLSPKVAAHHLGIKHGIRLVKQAHRCIRPEHILKVEEEVDKLIKVRFIREVKYLTWISSMVPVVKKNG
ncbi:uncharacterized protein LOC114271452 [Camellia sinensis]|uniref:uncharacterized protein LOC114271452 n=1 Tax=Camellia sinensis TaxID=4442 RepID=UPI001035D047|nr:uncharacterized protein LOC114271452 [Camellia sinensis]